MAGVYAALVLLIGLVEYIIERNAGGSLVTEAWDGLWLAASGHIRLGFGETYPVTCLGQAIIALIALCGGVVPGLLLFLSRKTTSFSLRESQLYAEVHYVRSKQLYQLEAVVLLQRWWRLVAMRKQKKPAAAAILPYFAQLQACKKASIPCRMRENATFKQQIDHFDSRIHSQICILRKDIASPLADAKALLAQVSSHAFSIQALCKSLSHRAFPAVPSVYAAG
jgi:hypothetical protein